MAGSPRAQALLQTGQLGTGFNEVIDDTVAYCCGPDASCKPAHPDLPYQCFHRINRNLRSRRLSA